MIRRILGWFRVRRNDPILISVGLLVLLSLALPLAIVLDLTWNAWRWTIFDNTTLVGFAALSGILLGLSPIVCQSKIVSSLRTVVSVCLARSRWLCRCIGSGIFYRIWDGGQLSFDFQKGK